MTERIAEQSIGNWQSDRHNLPMQLTSFIGREREVAAVRAFLQRPEIRLVTLTGPGGTGKTRLGLQVAAELMEGFSDGVFFVNLAPLSDPELVVPTIAQTLGLKEAAGQPLLDLVSAWLREKELLLLLDDFEQVVGAASQVAMLLARCSKLNVLVTSRTVLHVRGEQEFAVPPLAVPDPKHLLDLVTLSQYEAVALFIARAQAVKPDFHMNHANAAAITVICTRLDGLPLAIELAAARIKLLPPQALLRRLEHRLQVLTGGAQALFFQGDSAKAQVVLEEGLAISKQIGHKGWEGLMLSLLGQVFLQQDNIALARSGLEESLALSRELGLQDVTASSLCVLARIEAGQGNHATARALYEESLALSRDGGNYKWDIASFLEGLAAVVVPEGEPAWAARLWGAAEALRETSGAPLPAIYHADYEQAFATAWVEGRGMTVDQVLVAREAVTMPVAASPVHVAASPAGKSAPTYPDGLTAREVEVLRLVSQGLSNAEIADQLIISLLTVKAHMRSLYNKLGISSRSAATRYAIEHHLM